MTYDPYYALGLHPDVELAVMPLPVGSAWWLAEQRVILVDSRLSKRARRCAVAHELEHVEAGDDGSAPGLHAHIERFAGREAARKLIPLTALVGALLWSQDEHELAEELNVDEDTLRTRLRTLTAIEHQYVDDRLWLAEGRMA